MDALIEARELERLAKEFPLQSLSPEELDLGREPMTRDPAPRRKVRAWVRFGPHAAQIEGVVHCWTGRALGIAFTVGEKELRAWVWASAAEALDE